MFSYCRESKVCGTHYAVLRYEIKQELIEPRNVLRLSSNDLSFNRLGCNLLRNSSKIFNCLLHLREIFNILSFN